MEYAKLYFSVYAICNSISSQLLLSYSANLNNIEEALFSLCSKW